MSINNPTLDELLSSPIGSKWSVNSCRTSYTQEIQQMMYSFGDFEKPLYESAQLVEHIVHQQMTSVLWEAYRVALTRGSRTIGVEEILFLMRFDRSKLSRLIKHLSVKDLRRVCTLGTVDNEDIFDNTNNNNESNKSDTNCVSNTSTVDEMSSKPPQQTKRVKLCYDFLSSIDSTGALLVVFDESFVDSVKHERDVRTDRMSNSMSESNYYKFSELRQTSFANKSRPSKFRDWLLKDSQMEMKPNVLALEVLQYLAKESVSQIIDLSLLVKQDLERDICDPLTALLPHKMVNKDFPNNHSNDKQSPDSEGVVTTQSSQNNPFFMSLPSKSVPKNSSINLNDSQKSKKRKRGDNSKLSFESHSYCITPNHIREALRRYFTPSGPFVKSHKSSNQTSIHNKKLLCL